MIDDQLTPEEQQAIQRLRAARTSKLDATAREAIRQQMLNELHAGPISSPNRVLRGRAAHPIWRFAAIAAAVAVAAIVLVTTATFVVVWLVTQLRKQ